MKTNYFYEIGKRTYKEHLRGIATFFAAFLRPNWSFKWGLDVVCQPGGNRSYLLDVPGALKKRHFVETPFGKVSVLQIGSGAKNIVLLHGWADTSLRFRFLIPKLLEMGFTVWSIDAIGHGYSEGQHSHIVGFTVGLEKVLDWLDKQGVRVGYIIAHSMGAAAVMASRHPQIIGAKTVLVSLPSQFISRLFERTYSLGLSKWLVVRMLNRLSKVSGIVWSDLEPSKTISRLDPQNTLFIHDEGDPVARYPELKCLIESHNLRLHSTRGLGHTRVLRHSQALETILGFLASKNHE